jgi:two-component system, chemotaxis family, protein-glutamate methylesterase/glutaminase
MTGHDIIVIGASAGGVEALSKLAATLPGDLPAALFVTVHFPAQSTSVLPAILSRAGPLPAHHPEDGEPIELGRIYVAPPDKHLLVKRDHLRVVRGPRVVGMVLSGYLDDGTAGLRAIKARGGAVDGAARP